MEPRQILGPTPESHVDTSDEACAVACMLVSNPSGVIQSEGWKKRVNDLIRALRDERNDLRQRLKEKSDA
jgi:hypothetical protein